MDVFNSTKTMIPVLAADGETYFIPPRSIKSIPTTPESSLPSGIKALTPSIPFKS